MKANKDARKLLLSGEVPCMMSFSEVTWKEYQVIQNEWENMLNNLYTCGKDIL